MESRSMGSLHLSPAPPLMPGSAGSRPLDLTIRARSAGPPLIGNRSFGAFVGCPSAPLELELNDDAGVDRQHPDAAAGCRLSASRPDIQAPERGCARSQASVVQRDDGVVQTGTYYARSLELQCSRCSILKARRQPLHCLPGCLAATLLIFAMIKKEK